MTGVGKDVISRFEDLHQIPEPAFHEEKTAKYIGDALLAFGYDVRTGLGGTGVVGILETGVTGPVVALRADMDCLVHTINGQEVYRHSCGHDGHSAMVLTVAEKIIREKLIEKGTFKVLFQPAEETFGGARAILKTGILDDVEYIVGMHLRTKAQAPKGKATPAIYFGASTIVEAEIEGKTAHGARPHLGISAIDAVGAIIYGINSIHLDPMASWSAKMTRVIAGGASANAICPNASIAIDLRAQKNEDMEALILKVKEAVVKGANLVGATAEVTVGEGCPAAVYDEGLISLAKDVIVNHFGEAGLMPSEITAGGEDFQVYAYTKPNIKAIYLGLGCDLTPGLHDPNMCFDQSALQDGVDILTEMITKIFSIKS